jgi:TRAP transporter TAXI family solute receptor
MFRRILSFLFCISLFCLSSCGKSDGKTKYIKIGTGSQTGVYYSAGLAIGDLINANTNEHRIVCAVESTAGSVFNINTLASSSLDIGIAQADRQYQAVNGLGSWDSNPQTELRFICSLHPETIMFLAADDSEIKTLADVKDHVISVGAPGSGTRDNALDVLAQLGLKIGVDFQGEGLSVTDASLMLQDKRIDGFFYTAGHPNGAILEASNGKRKVHFVPILGMDDLLKESPYYTQTVIPVGEYSQVTNTEDVPTIGMLTSILSTSKVSDDIVYEVTKAIFSNLAELKKKHPSLADLSEAGMRKGRFAPLHPAAARYFNDAAQK